MVFLLFIPLTEVASQDNFRVLFYNVENLFDALDDSLKDDNDFLPDGFMRWSEWKYREKLKNIAKVITAVGGMYSPALVGLCEIENDSVLHDLTKRSALSVQGYDFIVTDSPDERGIDVALLYQRHQFKLLEHTEYDIKFSDKRRRPTRNILHAVGTLENKDTLDVFVVHFPSRVSGKLDTEEARTESAQVLRNKVDSIFSVRINPNLIIMGDFNDEPDDKSILNVLKANQIKEDILNNELYNLLYIKNKTPECGTYKYQGVWSVIDHLIVNGRLLNNANSTHVKNNNAYIYNESFLLEKDEKYYGMKPFRTNIGPRYNGGFSDHLPIYIDINILFNE
ncbi:MAG: hypothetical protein GX670_01450 [Bacteroidales bacterium]|nr:hypothetical protein [Bacteroidales bacterium]